MQKKISLETVCTFTGEQGQTLPLQIDQDANLYVNGKKVTVQEKVSLVTYERILATATTLAIVAQAVIAYTKA